MTTHAFPPRKQRTIEHVRASRCTNHVERAIYDEGHTAERFQSDYGYDLMMFTFDPEGYAEEGSVYLQLKASGSLPEGEMVPFDLDVRDYNRWIREPMPVILVLFDASRRRAFWLYIQGYFEEDVTRAPRRGTRTVRVHLPVRQVVNRRAIAQIRRLKQQALERLAGMIYHV